MPACPARRSTASEKERWSIFITNVRVSPPSWQPKQWKSPLLGLTWKDGDFSSWKGQSPLRFPPPAFRSWRYSETTASIGTASRTAFTSSSLIRPATREFYGCAVTSPGGAAPRKGRGAVTRAASPRGRGKPRLTRTRTRDRTEPGSRLGDEALQRYVRIRQRLRVHPRAGADQPLDGVRDIPHIHVHPREHPSLLHPERDELALPRVAPHDHLVVGARRRPP